MNLMHFFNICLALCGKTKISERREHEMLKTICVSQHNSLPTLMLLWVAQCKTVRQINIGYDLKQHPNFA